MLKHHKALRDVLREASASASLCWQCQQKRAISQTFLKKQAEARRQWQTWAVEIKAGTRQSMLTILEERGYVHSIAGARDDLDQLMIDKRIGAYVGVDATASSLHVGHMVALMPLFWMHLHGFSTTSLIGGTTARFGDPTGRLSARREMTSTERKANLISMHYQLKKIWVNLEKKGPKHGYKRDVYWRRALINNGTWWGKTPFVDVLKLLGTGLRLGTMLSRDTVKTRMESGDGMSFAEFCYPILQAWDWWVMYQANGIQLQIGGSDQYGNIVAGIDAIKHLVKTHPDIDIRQEGGIQPLTTPYGFTVPLLTTAAGEKFGKSAGNAIWLDKDMTSLFDLYGFFIRTPDADVERYLKLFTFLPLSEIQSIVAKHKNDPSQRLAQHKLAFEFLDLVHGEDAAKTAEAQHRALFQKPTISSLTSISTDTSVSSSEQRETGLHKIPKPNPLLSNQNAQKRLEGTYSSPQLNKYAPQTNAENAPSISIVLPKSLIYNQSIAKVLYSAGMVTSRSEGHRLAQNNGAYIGMRSSGKEKMGDELDFHPAKLHDSMQTWRSVIQNNQDGDISEPGEEGLLLLRQGKWKVRMVRIVTDQKFEEMGLEDPPGWQEFKAVQAKERAERGGSGANTQDEPLLEGEEEADANENSEYIMTETQNRRAKQDAFMEGRRKAFDYERTERQVERAANMRRRLEEGQYNFLARAEPGTPTFSPADRASESPFPMNYDYSQGQMKKTEDSGRSSEQRQGKSFSKPELESSTYSARDTMKKSKDFGESPAQSQRKFFSKPERASSTFPDRGTITESRPSAFTTRRADYRGSRRQTETPKSEIFGLKEEEDMWSATDQARRQHMAVNSRPSVTERSAAGSSSRTDGRPRGRPIWMGRGRTSEKRSARRGGKGQKPR